MGEEHRVEVQREVRSRGVAEMPCFHLFFPQSTVVGGEARAERGTVEGGRIKERVRWNFGGWEKGR